MLQDQIAIVTGGAQGIGEACARLMAEAGASVTIADIDLARAQEAAGAISAAGHRAEAIRCDVGDLDDIAAMIEHVVVVHGRLDCIVNNAGVTRRSDIMELTEADWDRIWRINAKGVFFCLQTAARQMIEQGGGRIINIASIAGKGYAGTSNAIYASSKGAVISLTKTAAQQLGRHNINVNSICPGVTDTALSNESLRVRAETEDLTIEEVAARRTADIPLGRANEPEDLGALAVFLASPAARNITGQCYNVDGGIIPD